MKKEIGNNDSLKMGAVSLELALTFIRLLPEEKMSKERMLDLTLDVADEFFKFLREKQ